MISSEIKRLRDKVAIVGVGTTKLTKPRDSDKYVLAAEAFKNALEDCGLAKEQIDGFHSCPRLDYDITAKGLGLTARYAYQFWGHHRLMGNILAEAALAVSTGMANYFAIISAESFGTKRAPFLDEKDPAIIASHWREGGGPEGEDPVYGMVSTVAIFAMWTQRYMQLYNATSRDLGAVAVAARKWACLNPLAVLYGKPMTIEDHQQSRWIVEPLRLLDCAMMCDGGASLILTTAERAKDLKQPPVFISGIAPVGATELPYGIEFTGLIGKKSDGPMERISSAHVDQAYQMADAKPQDMDALYTYDAHTIMVFKALESARICPRGEAKDFIKGGRIEPGGKFPVNTNGGLLSEGQCAAWHHKAEIVRQLRGQCGERQVKNAKAVIWIGGYDDCAIFGR